MNILTAQILLKISKLLFLNGYYITITYIKTNILVNIEKYIICHEYKLYIQNK